MVFTEMLSLGEMLLLALASSCKPMKCRMRSVRELISWIGPFPGFSCQKSVPNCYGPYAKRYCSSLLRYSPTVTPKGLKISFSPTTKPQNTIQDQHLPGLIQERPCCSQKGHAKACRDCPNTSRACLCSASLSNTLEWWRKAIKMNLYTAAITAILGGEELTCR